MTKYIYGWESANGEQLYVYQNKIHWGVSNKLETAATFKTIEDCNNHWRSKHAFPEKYEHLIGEGHLAYFDAKTQQRIIS